MEICKRARDSHLALALSTSQCHEMRCTQLLQHDTWDVCEIKLYFPETGKRHSDVVAYSCKFSFCLATLAWISYGKGCYMANTILAITVLSASAKRQRGKQLCYPLTPPTPSNLLFHRNFIK